MNRDNLIKSIPGLDNQFARKGAVATMVAVLMVVLLGCVALAVDIGYLYVARTELQRAADAGALAGAQALGRDSDSLFGEFLYLSRIYSQAQSLAEANSCAGQSVAIDAGADVRIGYIADPHDLDASLQVVALDQCNAVQVTAHRTSASSLGRISLFFGPIFGVNSSGVGARATAVLDDRFYAYTPTTEPGGVGAIPFTIDEDIWEDLIVQGNGPDEYGYDPETGEIQNLPDGVPEIKLFPEKLGPSTPAGGDEGAGNFGILHVGSGSIGTSTIVEQIINGITKQDFIDLTGEPMIEFYSQVSGTPVTYDAASYDIYGDPGMKVGMEDAMQQKTAKKVGFFLHSTVSGQGSNTIFNVVGTRFGRVMGVELQGNDKAIIIQPVPHYGPDILTSPYVPSSDRLIGSLQLVR